jgi:hypothetical protein
LERRFEPSLDIQNDPLALGVFPHRAQQQFVRDVIEQTFDIELKQPIVSPASLPGYGNCVKGRFLGPISVGIRQKVRLHFRFEIHLRHHLGDSILYRWDTENSHTSALFRYFHRFDRRREIGPRGHSIPDFVEVIF